MRGTRKLGLRTLQRDRHGIRLFRHHILDWVSILYIAMEGNGGLYEPQAMFLLVAGSMGLVAL